MTAGFCTESNRISKLECKLRCANGCTKHINTIYVIVKAPVLFQDLEVPPCAFTYRLNRWDFEVSVLVYSSQSFFQEVIFQLHFYVVSQNVGSYLRRTVPVG